MSESTKPVEKVSVELTPGEAATLAKMRALAIKEGESTVRCRVLPGMEICLSQPSPSQGAYRDEFQANLQSYITGSSMATGPWKRVPASAVLLLYQSDFENFTHVTHKAPKGRVEKVKDSTPITPVEEYEAMLAAEMKRRHDMGRLAFFKDQAGLSVKEEAEYSQLLQEYGERGIGAKLKNIFGGGQDDRA
jgi:hypothetical protein